MADEDPAPKFPSGFAAHIEMGINSEPLIKLTFMGDGEAVAIVLAMDEVAVMMSIVGESMMRAAVIREMTTIFPEQRDTIMANLLFRWSGGGGLEDGSADQSS
jgi:hypothetical protein